jgi:hypothetical protein
MKKGKVWVVASPHRVPVSRFPGFVQGIQGFRLSLQGAVHASRIVENRGLVGAQGDGQIELAQGVVHSIQFGIVVAHQDARSRILGHMFQVVLERGDEPLGHVAPGFFFAHGAERVHDGHINVVVFTACFYGGFRDVQNFLVASRGEQGAAEQVIGALAVALAVDSLFDHAHGLHHGVRRRRGPRSG